MKLNKRGFTLIELLAVIVLLLIISTLVIPNISSAIERNKAKQDAAKIKAIISLAELYYGENKNSLGFTNCINISDLDLSDDEKIDSNGKAIEGKICYENGQNFTYQKN